MYSYIIYTTYYCYKYEKSIIASIPVSLADLIMQAEMAAPVPVSTIEAEQLQYMKHIVENLCSLDTSKVLHKPFDAFITAIYNELNEKNIDLKEVRDRFERHGYNQNTRSSMTSMLCSKFV